MISIPRSVDSAHSAFASLRVSSHPRKRGVLAVLCLALATMLCGAGQNALAQTAYFSGAQTVLSGGFNGPEDVAVDASGNVYVADTNNGGVDEILSSGGYTTKRTLVSDPDYFPVAVAVDGSGNVYFSDNYPPVVYLVELMAVNGSIPISATPSFLSHAIETLLDNTYDFPSGMAVDGSGNVYMPYYNYVLEYLASSGGETGWGGPFNRTIGLALDASGNIYVADRGNHAVYEILAVNGSVPASPTINTLASGFSFPWGVAVDASGNVYVADNGNNVVDEILAVNGSIPASPTILTLGSGFNQPAGLGRQRQSLRRR